MTLPAVLALMMMTAASAAVAQPAPGNGPGNRPKGPANMEHCVDPKANPDQRIAACTMAIENGRLSNSDIAVAHNNRAVAAHYKGQYDRAILDHDEAIRLRPDYAEAYSDRGNARLSKGLYALAVKDYSEAIRLQPNAPGYFNNRCYAYAMLGQTEEALADCDQAIKLAPKRTATLFDSRGYALLRAKRYEQAIRDYNTALGIDGKYASSIWGRGYAYLQRGEKEKAESDFKIARVIDPAIDFKMADRGLTK